MAARRGGSAGAVRRRRGQSLILLDTHALVWWRAQAERLSKPAAAAIRRAQASSGLAIAAVTLWELALLARRGAFEIRGTLQGMLEQLSAGVTVLPLTAEVAALAAQFGPDYPTDPADRLIGATALSSGLVLVTRDESIRRSKLINTLW